MRRREDLWRAIDEERERLAALERAQREATALLAALRSELAALGAEPAIRVEPHVPIPSPPPPTPEKKVRLFRALFRGRSDVYPVRFESKKTNRPGYAPACSKKFVPGICNLPRVKCGECPTQGFLPVDDAAILAHLQGKHVMGVYPLLVDDTCWLLAADFDKKSWREDVAAFMETCRRVGVPAAAERSRSGNGAHVWFFFSEPVPAVLARRMGCYLITETMSRRHELGMDSYDRLFPNQDTLPRGGFGNLIALPLQRGPRQDGNTVFLNANLEPLPDEEQWPFLASVPRLDRATVEAIAAEATRRGVVLDLRRADPGVEEDEAPWTRPPSGHRPFTIAEPLPKQIRAVRAQRLFVEKVGLPSSLLNQVKRLAAFQNPEFYKKQNMRLPTTLTPRVIACAEDLSQHIALPRGCEDGLANLLGNLGVELEIEDRRAAGEHVDFAFQGTLSQVQELAARALLRHDNGVCVAPPGLGKTVLGTYLVAKRGTNTLVLVHRQPLLDQWRAQLSLFLGLEPRAIGQFGAGKHKANGRLDVAMIQSLVRKGQVADLVAGYGQVIVDECHHVPAVSFERVLSEVTARYVVGLTATPERRDGHHPILEMQLGPIRFVADAKREAYHRALDHRLIIRETRFELPERMAGSGIQSLYAALAEDQERNQQILDDVAQALELGRSPLVLTERRDHLERLAAQLSGAARHLVVLHGGGGVKERRAIRDRLAAIPEGEGRLLLATGRYAGEGFDDARLDTLFLAMPVSWKGTLVQYSGRLHRQHAGKRDVFIFDYVDRRVPVFLRMFERRLRGYRAIGYAAEEDRRCVVDS